MALVAIPTGELSEFDLPRVCVVTGRTEGITFRDVKFQWYPRWIGLLILVNFLVALVVALFLMRRVKGQLPFTDEGWAIWRRALALRFVSVLAMIAFIVVAIVLMVDGSGEDRVGLGFALLGVAILLPILTFAVFTRKRVVTCLRIADGTLTLQIPSEEAAQLVTARLHVTLAPIFRAQAVP